MSCRRHFLLPSPLWGGVGGGGRATEALAAPLAADRTTPHPDPPPQGGRERKGSIQGNPGHAAAAVSRGTLRNSRKKLSVVWRAISSSGTLRTSARTSAVSTT